MKTAIIVCVALLAGCHAHDCPADQPAKSVQLPPSPTRGAVGDNDLRIMVAEIASAKACDMLRGQFRPLRGTEDPSIVTGALWIRGCELTNSGTNVVFHLSGNGWQWADQKKHEAGGTFVVRQYVKFAVDANVPGALDLAYEPGSHVVSIWFSPSKTPDVTFTPMSGVDVDQQGLWSSIVGGLSSVVNQSPNKQGTREAKQQGSQQFREQLGQGLTVALALCTGYLRITTGHAPSGSLGPPDAGELHGAPIELQPGGLMVFGPELAPDGYTVDVTTRGGAARVALACTNDDAHNAEQAIEGFLADQPPRAIKTLAEAVVDGHGHLHAAAQRCKVAMMVRAVAKVPVTVEWTRPDVERARADGGGVLSCKPHA